MIEAVERCRRRLEAARAELVDHIDRLGLHAHDGHVNAKAMLRHVGNVSGAEAGAVDKTAKAMRSLPGLAQGFRQGRVGVDQIRLVGRVNANPRVVHYIGEHDDWFVECASSMPFADFEAVVRQWERLIDVDGARDRNDRNHQARDFRLCQDLVDLSWTAAGQFAAFQGAAVDEVFRRRADAFWQMVQDAANASGSVAADLVHNIVRSSESFEATVASLATGESPRLDPLTHRCSTLDGVPLEPIEAAATVLVAKVRRVMVDASGTWHTTRPDGTEVR